MTYPFKEKEDAALSDDEASQLYKLRQVGKSKGVTDRDVIGVLKKFRAAAETEQRLPLLKQMADIVVRKGKVVSGWIENMRYSELQDKRSDFNRIKNSKFPLTGALCWVCAGVAAVRHHVILLKNGGPVTSRSNIIYLCLGCHNQVHPWLVQFDGVTKSVRAVSFMNAFLQIFELISAARMNQEVAEKEAVRIISSLFSTT